MFVREVCRVSVALAFTLQPVCGVAGLSDSFDEDGSSAESKGLDSRPVEDSGPAKVSAEDSTKASASQAVDDRRPMPVQKRPSASSSRKSGLSENKAERSEDQTTAQDSTNQPRLTKPSPRNTKQEQASFTWQEHLMQKEKTSVWTWVFSQSLEGSNDLRVLDLIEDVVLVDDDLRVEADWARVHFLKKVDRMDKAEATGDVRMFRTDPQTGDRMIGRSAEARYFAEKQLIRLTGNAHLWRNESLIRGDVIIYDMSTGVARADRLSGVLKKEETDAKGSP